MRRKGAIAGGLIIAGLVATLLLARRPASVSCYDATWERTPTIQFHPSQLTVRFRGETKLQYYGTASSQLTATLNFGQRLEPGTYRIRGAGRYDGREWNFTASPEHAAQIASGGLAIEPSYPGKSGDQDLAGVLLIAAITESELRGTLELSASGDVGCRGDARISTPLELKLTRGRSK